MKQGWILLSLFAAAATWISGAEPRIYCPFDKGIDSADRKTEDTSNGVVLDSGAIFVKGMVHPKSDLSDGEKLRPAGLSGRALLTGRNESQTAFYGVTYRPQGGIAPEAGTFTFWLKPLTWDGKDRHARMFVSAEGPSLQLFIYQYYQSDRLYFYIKNGKTASVATASIADWKKNQWYFVACSWNRTTLKIYLNGILKAETELKSAPEKPFGTLSVGAVTWPDMPGLTLVDEFRYYPKSLSADEVADDYRTLAAQNSGERGPVNITMGRKTPQQDGRIHPFEYAFSGAPFFDIMTQSFTPDQSRAAFSYDDKHFYFAVRTPAGKDFRTEKKLRDSNVWEDDSLELHLVSPDGKEKYQFIFNAANVLFDAKNGEVQWNAANVRSVSEIRDGTWTLEAVVPWKDLGMTGPPDFLRVNVCRAFRQSGSLTATGPCLRRFADPANFTVMKFADGLPPVDLVSLGELFSRQLDFRVDVLGSKSGALDVKLFTANPVLPFQFEKKSLLEAGKTSSVAVKKTSLPENTPLNARIQVDGKPCFDAVIPCRTLVPVQVSYLYADPRIKKLFFVIRSNLPGIQSELEVSFRNAERKTVKTDRIEIRSGERPEYSVSLDGIAPGTYTVSMVCRAADGKELFRNQEEITIPAAKPEWADFRGGLEDVVPPPWTPILARAGSFECWGRRYGFGDHALVNSIVSGTSELLAGKVVLNVNGESVPFLGRLEKVLNSEAFYAMNGTKNGLKFRVQMRAEFDGLLWFTVNVVPEDRATVRTMTLSIPLDRRYLTSFDDNRGIMNKLDLVREKRPVVYSDLSVSPFFWIGNDDVGLMGGVPNLRGWRVKDKARSLALKLTERTATIELNLVDTPFAADKERTFEFYLQATPVKPLNRLSRTFREGGNTRIWCPYRRKYFGSMRPDHLDRKNLEEIRRGTEKDGLRTFHYAAPHGASPYAPDWHYWGLLWHSPYPKLGQGIVDGDDSTRDLRNRVAFTYACLDCKSFFDYKLCGIAKMIQSPEYGIRNLYYDLVWPKSCENPHHGCAWTDEFGDKMASFDLKGTREFNKRTYRLLKAKNPDAMFVYHLINTRTPADSFCDLIVQGESYDRAVAEQENYYDVLTPDLVRIAYGTRLSEQQIWLIPQFQRALILFRPAREKNWMAPRPETDRACRHFLGYLSVHNIGFMNGTGVRREGNRYYEVMDFLPWDESGVFHPYWKQGPVTKLAPASDRVMVSAYSRGNRALIALLNDTDTEQNIAVKVDTAALLGKKKNLTAVDGLEPGAGFPLADDRMTVPVPKRGFRLLKLQ